MVAIEMEYQGELRCRAVHEPSGTALATDAPRDNQGLGESFSPTDLVATALGTCVLTTMGITARTLGVELTGATAVITKEMSAQPPRRIARLVLTLHLPAGVSDEHRRRLESSAHGCPVHRSLHPDVEAPIEFLWA